MTPHLKCFSDKNNPLQKQRWLIPTNVRNNHWVLLVFHPATLILHILDSNYTPGDDVTFITDAFNHTLDSLFSSWRGQLPQYSHLQTSQITDIEMQEGDDTYNCGPFICWYGECIILGQPLELDALDEFDIETVRQCKGAELEQAHFGIKVKQLQLYTVNSFQETCNYVLSSSSSPYFSAENDF